MHSTYTPSSSSSSSLLLLSTTQSPMEENRRKRPARALCATAPKAARNVTMTDAASSVTLLTTTALLQEEELNTTERLSRMISTIDIENNQGGRMTYVDEYDYEDDEEYDAYCDEYEEMDNDETVHEATVDQEMMDSITPPEDGKDVTLHNMTTDVLENDTNEMPWKVLPSDTLQGIDLLMREYDSLRV